MVNKLFYSWIIISILLLSFAVINTDERVFLPIIVLIASCMIVLTYLKTRELRYISRIILGASMFSILSMISLLDNYVSSRVENQDGISISNQLAYLYIGEDGWSQELFRSAFENALLVTGILVTLYFLVLIIEIGIFKKRCIR